jgi:lipopolysaccharide exporter
VTDVGSQAPGRASTAMAWAGLTMVLGRGATLLATLVLARLLVPADFGLFAVGILVINYLDRFKDVGVGAALIYRREPWTRLAPTALPLAVGSAAVLSVGTFVVAPLAADFFYDPRAADILRALSLVLLISGLSIVPESKMRREMDFRRRVVPEVVAAVVKGVVSVALAVAGLGVFALVWGQLAGTLVQSSLYWALCRWRPRLGWDRSLAVLMLKYGIASSVVAVLSVFIENMDYLVVGRRMSAESLGYYVMAYRLPELSVFGVCIVAGQVFFPMFARLQDDLPRLAGVYLDAVRNISLVTLPVGAALACLAPEVISTLYSDKWDAAIPVLRLLAVFALVSSMSFHAGEIYKATGRPGILNTLAIGEVVLLLPLLWLAAGGDIVTVAATMAVAAIPLTAVRLLIAVRILRLDPGALVRSFVPSVTATATMSVAVVAASYALTQWLPDWPPVVRLVVLGLLGLVVYVGAVRLVARDVFDRVTPLLWRLVPSRGRV